MSIDWNWGIFLQQAPFGNTTYLGWIGGFSGDNRFVDLRSGLSLSSSVHFSAFYVPFQTVFSPVWVRCMSNCSATCR